MVSLVSRARKLYLHAFRIKSRFLPSDHVQTIHDYLPDFCFFEPSTNRHRQIVAKHWNVVFVEDGSHRSTMDDKVSSPRSPRGAGGSSVRQLYDAFYSYLDRYSPQVVHTFRGSMHVRSKALVHITGSVRTMLSQDDITSRVVALTKTPMRFGVKLEYFNPVGNALIYSLKHASDEEWSDTIEDAWRRLYAHCAAELMVHHIESTEHKSDILSTSLSHGMRISSTDTTTSPRRKLIKGH